MVGWVLRAATMAACVAEMVIVRLGQVANKCAGNFTLFLGRILAQLYYRQLALCAPWLSRAYSPSRLCQINRQQALSVCWGPAART